MSNGLTQAEREIGVSFAPALEDDVLLLQSFVHDAELGRPGVTTLDLRSERADIDPAELLGQPATIRLNTSEGERYIHGYVWSLTAMGQAGGLWMYYAEVRPWISMLDANRDYRVFLEKSAVEVVEAVLGSHSGAMELQNNLFGQYRTRYQAIQYAESDFNFMSRLLEDEGVYYVLEYSEEGESLVLCDDSTQHEPKPGVESLPYQPTDVVGESALHEEALTSFARLTSYRCARYASVDFAPERPSTYVLGLCDGSFDHGPSWRQRMAHTEVFGGSRTLDEAETAARLRMEESEASADLFSGETRSRLLTPGTKFGVTEHPGYGADDRFVVTSVTISATAAEYVVGQSGGSQTAFTCRFTAIDAERPFRPARTTPKPKASMQTALVVAAADGDDTPDLAADDYCCVRLRFHWDHYADGRHPVGDVDDTSDGGSSCWARTSQSWAGKNFGWVSIPHPGQEVVVDFINGDPDRPLVVGRVYNEDNRPMMTPAENRQKMQLRDSGQNHIVMGAESGQQVIEMYSPSSGTRIRIGGG
ncbi:MAG: type VI secretion system tip protein TssI/VgrG [Planctomycetota bacterium]